MSDNYELWEAYDAKMEALLRKRPVCCHCGDPIQDDKLFDINGELYHLSCAMEEFEKWTEDYE